MYRLLSFCFEVGEKFALLCYYAPCNGDTLLTFLDNLSARNYHYSLRNGPEENSFQL
jgi:hypothetical protein